MYFCSCCHEEVQEFPERGDDMCRMCFRAGCVPDGVCKRPWDKDEAEALKSQKPELARRVAVAMRKWVGELRNLAYQPSSEERDRQIKFAEEVLMAQANYMARLERAASASAKALEG